MNNLEIEYPRVQRIGDGISIPEKFIFRLAEDKSPVEIDKFEYRNFRKKKEVKGLYEKGKSVIPLPDRPLGHNEAGGVPSDLILFKAGKIINDKNAAKEKVEGVQDSSLKKESLESVDSPTPQTRTENKETKEPNLIAKKVEDNSDNLYLEKRLKEAEAKIKQQERLLKKNKSQSSVSLPKSAAPIQEIVTTKDRSKNGVMIDDLEVPVEDFKKILKKLKQLNSDDFKYIEFVLDRTENGSLKDVWISNNDFAGFGVQTKNIKDTRVRCEEFVSVQYGRAPGSKTRATPFFSINKKDA